VAELLTSLQLALFERLLDVGKLLERKTDRLLREVADLTFTQGTLLIRLRNAGGEERMTELARRLVNTPSGLTYQLRQLENRGLAIRVAAPGDDRGVLARITPAGREMLLAISQAQNDFIMENAIEPLASFEAEMMHHLLGKLQLQLRGEMTGGLLPTQVPPPLEELDGISGTVAS
jgi:DNA-binding MarR family transcriptional regulator